jgi:hypothetical protein
VSGAKHYVLRSALPTSLRTEVVADTGAADKAASQPLALLVLAIIQDQGERIKEGG